MAKKKLPDNNVTKTRNALTGQVNEVAFKEQMLLKGPCLQWAFPSWICSNRSISAWWQYVKMCDGPMKAGLRLVSDILKGKMYTYWCLETDTTKQLLQATNSGSDVLSLLQQFSDSAFRKYSNGNRIFEIFSNLLKSKVVYLLSLFFNPPNSLLICIFAFFTKKTGVWTFDLLIYFLLFYYFYVQVCVCLQTCTWQCMNPFAYITSCFSPSPHSLFKTMLS